MNALVSLHKDLFESFFYTKALEDLEYYAKIVCTTFMILKT